MTDSVDHYIAELHIDEDSLPVTSIEMQHERRVAIFDLLEENEFRPLESERGPYKLNVKLQDGRRLVFDVTRTNGSVRGTYTVSLVPFRRVVKDYFMICESYHNAIRTATSAQIEAIDMGAAVCTMKARVCSRMLCVIKSRLILTHRAAFLR
jgi:uncharacterized protein (UPF0262 family)